MTAKGMTLPRAPSHSSEMGRKRKGMSPVRCRGPTVHPQEVWSNADVKYVCELSSATKKTKSARSFSFPARRPKKLTASTGEMAKRPRSGEKNECRKPCAYGSL